MKTTDKKIGFYGGKFFPFHIGHLEVMLKAISMVDELYIIMFHNEEEERKLCTGKMKYEDLLPVKRLSWISKSLKGMEHISIREVSEGYGDWEAESNGVKQIIGRDPDLIFSSEPTYDEIFKELYPGTEHVIFDRKIPISGTQIREEGPYQYWEYLPKPVQCDFVKKVVIVGTESCAKSTTVKKLAKKYNTEYVEEYGRTICEEFNGSEGFLTDDIYPIIAYGHKMMEYEKAKLANKILFIDTEAIVTQYYSQLYNGVSQPVLDEVAKNQNYDLYVYLEPDVEWVDDGTRNHGEEAVRNQNNQMLKQMFTDRGVDFITVSGNYLERFNKIIELVDNLF